MNRCTLAIMFLSWNALASEHPKNLNARPIVEATEHKSLAYFLDNYEPNTGLIRDRAANFGDTPTTGIYRSASIAATGFGLAVFANASLRGLLAPDKAIDMITRTLRYALINLETFHGWFYHFVDWQDGVRFGTSEISTVDTGWLLVGALYAAEVFPHSDISTLANQLYARVNFPIMMTHDGQLPHKLTLSMGWSPEDGFIPWQWNTYAEQQVLLLLGISHPATPLPIKAWSAMALPWSVTRQGEAVIARDLPLFVHQYSALFLGPQDFRDGQHDFFMNSRHASNHSRATTLASTSFQTYSRGFWGLSASDGPDGYLAYSPVNHNGTVCLGCAAASVMFHNEQVLKDLTSWVQHAETKRFWGKYGFSDGINVDRGWYDNDVTGITVGAAFLAFANISDHSVWQQTPRPLLSALDKIRQNAMQSTSAQ